MKQMMVLKDQVDTDGKVFIRCGNNKAFITSLILSLSLFFFFFFFNILQVSFIARVGSPVLH